MVALSVVAAVYAATLTGCQKSPDVDETAPTRKVVAFQGQASPAYVGKWVSSDKSSTLDLGKDGGAKITSVTSGQGGQYSNELLGQWAVDGSKFFLKYKGTDGSQIVIESEASLSGSSLKLIQSGNKHKTVYSRQ